MSRVRTVLANKEAHISTLNEQLARLEDARTARDACIKEVEELREDVSIASSKALHQDAELASLKQQVAYCLYSLFKTICVVCPK